MIRSDVYANERGSRCRLSVVCDHPGRDAVKASRVTEMSPSAAGPAIEASATKVVAGWARTSGAEVRDYCPAHAGEVPATDGRPSDPLEAARLPEDPT